MLKKDLLCVEHYVNIGLREAIKFYHCIVQGPEAASKAKEGRMVG